MPAQSSRLDVTKTYKLFIDGKFPRSESGRTIVLNDTKGKVAAHVCRASRKDLREAVAAARRAQPGWRDATAYLRGQILYRMAEMTQGKAEELAAALRQGGLAGPAAQREVALSVDRLVAYAGWADKYAQVLGCNNAVAGPYYNFTVPEPTGVVVALTPEEPGLLGLVSAIAPVICSGNAVVAIAPGTTGASLPAVVLAEVVATSDVPGGVVNILTADQAELAPVVSGHRDIDAALGLGVSPGIATILREGSAENLKRVRIVELAKTGASKAKSSKPASNSVDLTDEHACLTPWWIEPFVEMKTIWHPSAT